VSKILVVIHLAQDDNDALGADRGWQRNFWIKTKTDLAWAFDQVEMEAAGLFKFETEGVTATFPKEGDDE